LLEWICFLPFCFAVLVGLWPSLEAVSRLATLGAVLLALLNAWVALHWLSTPQQFQLALFHWENYQFNFTLRYDLVSAVFLGVTTLLGLLVMRFSHFYMVKEPGQRRFFVTLLLFLSGICCVELAGDIDTLFMGWELVGISSFVLIGFYRQRALPVRHALKVYCIYRLCDVGLLVGAYLQHHNLGSSDFAQLTSHPIPQFQVLAISLLLLLSAAGKSGQFPFSFWVPRAMEGPTPSSAIFYGSLSIHAGVFLLLRTQPLWEQSDIARLAIGTVGLLTATLATGSSHVQSNLKGQIGYASVAQVGLMFVELALGFPRWVLLHFVGNAFLRCYQLLISPSLVAYLLRAQSQNHARLKDASWERWLPTRWQATLYVLASQEGYMEGLVEKLVFALPQWLARHVYLENSSVLVVWTRSLGLTCLMVVCVADWHTALPFLAGLLASFALGLAGIFLLPSQVRRLPLDHMCGLVSAHPRSARLLFVSFLGMSGFPITPAFFGEDLLLSAAIHLHPLAALVFTGTFIVNGIVLARTLTRLFFGPVDYKSGSTQPQRASQELMVSRR
jgi:NADH-quinone oxidoreductase subunit L